MVNLNQNYNKFMDRVGKKIQYFSNRMVIPGQRNAACVQVHTQNRIMQEMKNFFFSKSADIHNPLDATYQGFSESNCGYGDVSGLNTRGIEDITILSTILSYLGYLAIERSMDNPETNVSYQNLVNMQVDKTDPAYLVRSPFAPPNLNVSFRNKEVSSGAVAIATASALQYPPSPATPLPIVPGTAQIKYYLADPSVPANAVNYLLGIDNRQGGFSWKAVGTGVDGITPPSITSATINYEGGTLTVASNSANGATYYNATIVVDASKDHSGQSITRVTPKFENALLVARPNNVILESSLESEAYRNKMLQLSMEAGQTLDLAETAFRQLLESYVSTINYYVTTAFLDAATVSRAMNSATFVNDVEFDISGYQWGSFSSTKDDKVNSFILSLNSRLLQLCGLGGTVIVTGVEGCNILSNVVGRFVPNAAFHSAIDGMVGTYNNIPVIRSRLVDLDDMNKDYSASTGQTWSAGTYVSCYMAYKDPSGKAGPIAYGEFLPLYSTKNVLNFNNPSQWAQGLFSYNGTVSVVPQLIACGKIKRVQDAVTDPSYYIGNTVQGA